MKLAALVCLMGISSLSFAAATEKKIQLLKDPNGRTMPLVREDIVTLERLQNMFMMDARTPGLHAMLKRNTFKHRQKAVPVLIKVMKDSKYPEQNRWHATMLLAQVMGTKSAPFIAKFADHPHWMMRVAALKALLGLRQTEYHAVYAKALKDPSLIVRVQALDNISQLKISSLGPNVWSMMYDQSNYTGEKGARKRTSIVKSIIRTVGDVKFEKAQKPLAKLIQKPKYQDLIEDLDYSLEKITGEVSPNSVEQRRKFWSKVALTNDKKI
ncbi:HEAT repeat domain-containing protein [Peredibacter sp. HCB2-198]|uniref:HEAT repeat domain-containing protein n=1 Tax=Peredibacter sp. HCB2-198 TaxID=3383025 RepID=UPI0038B425DF